METRVPVRSAADRPEDGQGAPHQVPIADLSVVIPCLNAGDVLARQLEALATQAWDGTWDVIVADNGSTDETREVAASFDPRLPSLRIVDASDQRGRQHARNVGARVAAPAISFPTPQHLLPPATL